ncbi:hypothetical protein F511_40155 [Dorcoceras hygrometricum]|uniref:Uncharacterized protein n=1 Tax=Dorcoceras hygrometricum TaxID=472368 RepID=A0A2Z7AG97_9LAMI|nr:hypothetical protein F511_40155 [Dorcoceras hygrometricum]
MQTSFHLISSTTAEAVQNLKSRNSNQQKNQLVPSTTEFYLNRLCKSTAIPTVQTSFHLISSTTAEAVQNLKSRNSNQQKNQRISLYEDTATSHFFSNVDSGLQMGSNRKSNSQRIQRHQNHSNHRWRTAAIDGI